MTDYFTPTMRLYLDRLVDWEGTCALRRRRRPTSTRRSGPTGPCSRRRRSSPRASSAARASTGTAEAELTPDGGAQPPAHIRDAYDQLREAGLVSLPVSESYGGAGLPALLNGMFLEMISRADTSLMTVVGPPDRRRRRHREVRQRGDEARDGCRASSRARCRAAWT